MRSEGYSSWVCLCQGVVTQALTIGTFATGVKMRSRGHSYFLVSVKRSRALTGAKRVKVKRLSRLQTQDLRCFIRDIRRFLQRNTRSIVQYSPLAALLASAVWVELRVAHAPDR